MFILQDKNKLFFAMTRLSVPSLVFLSSLSPPFSLPLPTKNRQSLELPDRLDKFMELTFPLNDNSLKFVCVHVSSNCVVATMHHTKCWSKKLNEKEEHFFIQFLIFHTEVH